MRSTPSSRKMRAYRDRLRAQGLRPIQVWVPDMTHPGFKAALRRQIRQLDAAEEADALSFIAAAAKEPPR
jgi:hypothetical protein